MQKGVRIKALSVVVPIEQECRPLYRELYAYKIVILEPFIVTKLKNVHFVVTY